MFNIGNAGISLVQSVLCKLRYVQLYTHISRDGMEPVGARIAIRLSGISGFGVRSRNVSSMVSNFDSSFFDFVFREAWEKRKSF